MISKGKRKYLIRLVEVACGHNFKLMCHNVMRSMPVPTHMAYGMSRQDYAIFCAANRFTP